MNQKRKHCQDYTEAGKKASKQQQETKEHKENIKIIIALIIIFVLSGFLN